MPAMEKVTGIGSEKVGGYGSNVVGYGSTHVTATNNAPMDKQTLAVAGGSCGGNGNGTGTGTGNGGGFALSSMKHQGVGQGAGGLGGGVGLSRTASSSPGVPGGPWSRVGGREGLSLVVAKLIALLGHDNALPGVRDTPSRVARAVSRALASTLSHDLSRSSTSATPTPTPTQTQQQQIKAGSVERSQQINTQTPPRRHHHNHNQQKTQPAANGGTTDGWHSAMEPALAALFDEQVAQTNSNESQDMAPIVAVRDVGTSLWTQTTGVPEPCLVSLAYVPNGRIVGLSKVARVAAALSLRPWDSHDEYAEAVCEAMHAATGADGTFVWVRRNNVVLGRHGISTLQPNNGERFDELVILAPDVEENNNATPSLVEHQQHIQEDPRDTQAVHAAAERILLACIPAATPTLARAHLTNDMEARIRQLAKGYADWLLRRTQGYVTPTFHEAKQNIPAGDGGAAWTSLHCGRVSVVEKLPIESLCEHHMLPFQGHATVAVWASCDAASMRASKRRRGTGERDSWDDALPSRAELSWTCLRRSRTLQVQERLGFEIAGDVVDRVSAALGEHAVVHACVLVNCTHGCMLTRGVEQRGSLTSTVSWRGVRDAEAPAELRRAIMRSIQTSC